MVNRGEDKVRVHINVVILGITWQDKVLLGAGFLSMFTLLRQHRLR